MLGGASVTTLPEQTRMKFKVAILQERIKKIRICKEREIIGELADVTVRKTCHLL